MKRRKEVLKETELNKYSYQLDLFVYSWVYWWSNPIEIKLLYHLKYEFSSDLKIELHQTYL